MKSNEYYEYNFKIYLNLFCAQLVNNAVTIYYKNDHSLDCNIIQFIIIESYVINKKLWSMLLLQKVTKR